MIRLTGCLVVVILACAQGADDPPAVHMAPVLVQLDCGGREASATFHADSVVAIVDGERLVLHQVVSASGARYAGTADSTTALWNRGSETTITLRGEPLPTCHEAARAPFVARGNEPGWMLTLDSAMATLVYAYGEDTASAAVTSRLEDDVTAVVAAGSMTITIRAEPCADASTGMPHPSSVSVRVDSLDLRGCGGDPASLLQGETWVVTSIGSDSTVMPRPDLTFLRNGRVAGSTSCNRLAGSYTVGGEGLSLGPAITTKRACAPPIGEQESRFLGAWSRITRFEVQADRLSLLAGDAPLLVAARASAVR